MTADDLKIESIPHLVPLFNSCSNAVFKLDSTAIWLESLISLLCSTNQMDSQCIEDLLSMWSHGASFALESRSQSAVSIIKQKMMSNPDEFLVERLVHIYQHVIARSAQDNKNLLVRQLLPTCGEWKNLANETHAVNLMAKEYLQGYCFHPLPTSLSHFRPVQLNNWAGLVKIAFITSSVAVQNQLIEQDCSELLLNCYYASAAGDLLLDLYSKKLKVHFVVCFKIIQKF